MLVSVIKKSQFYFIFSFLALIIVGTLLLRLPILKGGRSLDWIDALFMATSSVCVTGLVTVDVTQFSLFGQMIIMVLMQLGGIGIMTMSGSIIVLMGKHMSWSESKILSNMTDNYSPQGVENMMRTIIGYTIVAESIGMFFLVIGFMLWGFGFIDSLWHALFHSVAAFCNAGMSTLPGNLEHATTMVKIIVALLVFLGGIGMYVVYDFFESFRLNRKMRVNTKLILVTTFILIVLGTLLLKFY
ncbi:MAG: potassium transporter, partial [Lentisphaeria bacterium]|nr:potassium transporter [Lentisphaeria bacterium]